jgi:hypothetical protein
LGGCQPAPPWTSENPEYALDSFLVALHNGDRETVWQFLHPDTQRFLEAHIQQLNADLSGHPDEVPATPLDALYQVLTLRPDTITADLEQSPESATVAIHTARVSRSVTLQRANERWLIQLIYEHQPLSAPLRPPRTPPPLPPGVKLQP